MLLSLGLLFALLSSSDYDSKINEIKREIEYARDGYRRTRDDVAYGTRMAQLDERMEELINKKEESILLDTMGDKLPLSWYDKEIQKCQIDIEKLQDQILATFPSDELTRTFHNEWEKMVLRKCGLTERRDSAAKVQSKQ